MYQYWWQLYTLHSTSRLSSEAPDSDIRLTDRDWHGRGMREAGVALPEQDPALDWDVKLMSACTSSSSTLLFSIFKQILCRMFSLFICGRLPLKIGILEWCRDGFPSFCGRSLSEFMTVVVTVVTPLLLLLFSLSLSHFISSLDCLYSSSLILMFAGLGGRTGLRLSASILPGSSLTSGSEVSSLKWPRWSRCDPDSAPGQSSLLLLLLSPIRDESWLIWNPSTTKTVMTLSDGLAPAISFLRHLRAAHNTTSHQAGFNDSSNQTERQPTFSLSSLSESTTQIARLVTTVQVFRQSLRFSPFARVSPWELLIWYNW